jgi:hypothetical protein
MTDTSPRDPDEHLARARLRSREILDDEVGALLVQSCSLHSRILFSSTFLFVISNHAISWHGQVSLRHGERVGTGGWDNASFSMIG